MKLLISLIILLLSTASFAVSESLCPNDGVKEVPPFASKAKDDCLYIDPGNGDPLVRFQYEIFHKTGISISAKDSGDTELIIVDGAEWVDLRGGEGPCATRDDGEYCTYLYWDMHLDNYLSRAAKNDDILTFGAGSAMEYLYFKDSTLLNGWACKGEAWTGGPNEILSCPASTSSAHSDGFQMIGSMTNDGWFIFQDSKLVNGHTQLMLFQSGDDRYPTGGSFLFQGSHVGTTQKAGLAEHWIDDCYSRGSNTPCENNRATADHPANEVWLVDVYGNVRIKFSSVSDKIIIVNTGCDENGCNGEMGFKNGWPHPWSAASKEGPGTCPDGFIGECSATDAKCYCYNSLEKAKIDNKLPPFVHLSDAGWEGEPVFSIAPAMTPSTVQAK
jgi:hypothetical protein